METTLYLVRYGAMGHVGRFSAGSAAGHFERGQSVVLQTARGTELGEVLAPVLASRQESPTGVLILRAAEPEDLARARAASGLRPEYLDACTRLFDDGVWPIMLVDIEPLLDDRRAVLYYLGPHHLDDAGLRAALRTRLGLDAILEPIGLDESVAATIETGPEPGGCGSCGSSTGGGCGTSARGAASHGGCGSCAVKDLVRARSRRLVPTTS